MDKPHKKRDDWQLAVDVAVEIHETTEDFPKEVKYSLAELD